MPIAQWPHSLRPRNWFSGRLFFYPRPFIIPNQVCRAVLFTRMVSYSISRLPHRLGEGEQQDKHSFEARAQ